MRRSGSSAALMVALHVPGVSGRNPSQDRRADRVSRVRSPPERFDLMACCAKQPTLHAPRLANKRLIQQLTSPTMAAHARHPVHFVKQPSFAVVAYTEP